MSSQMPDYFGTLKSQQNRRPKVKYESLEQGNAIYRILPSFDASRRQISQTYHVHWLTGEDGKKMKVSCTYFSERYCPICEAHRETKTQWEAAQKSDPSSEHTQRLAAAEQALRSSKTIYYNALNANNEVVVLQLTSEAAGELENAIVDALTNRQFDPLALNGGAWFIFKKNGKGRGTVKVDLNRISMKDAAGEIVEKLDRRPVSDELAATLPGAVANIFDPKSLWIKTYTSAQLADYLRGKPLPVEQYNRGGSTPQAASPSAPEPQAAAPQPAPVAQPATVAPAAPVAAASTVETAPRVGAKTAADYAAEAARLRELSKKQ